MRDLSFCSLLSSRPTFLGKGNQNLHRASLLLHAPAKARWFPKCYSVIAAPALIISAGDVTMLMSS